MEKNDVCYKAYLAILQEELVPALGCTEPIALAYAAAKATAVLGCKPERLVVGCSGNIVKNVKGVKVPNADDMKGIKTASILGAIGGDSEKLLEALEGVSPEAVEETRQLVEGNYCKIHILEGISNLHIITEVFSGEHSAMVEISHAHTNIIRIVKDGKELFQSKAQSVSNDTDTRTLLSFDKILDFADSVELDDIRELIEAQIHFNTEISDEGLRGTYGANVGKSLLKIYGNDVKVRAKARAAAGSDARMGGSAMPVVINSGSGNQGLTVSLPVIEYAREYKKSDEALYRALIVSNLMAIYQKTSIGKLSAYCGAVSAACASGAAIAYLMGESRQVIQDTMVNTLGDVAGIVCDGAKASCAAKIASSVDAAIMGYSLASMKNRFDAGDGLIKHDIEDTIQSFGRLAKQGMAETDKTILNIMIES